MCAFRGLFCSTALNVELPKRSEVHAAVAMPNLIKSPARCKVFAEIPTELQGIIAEMIKLSENVFDYIQERHDETQRKLDALTTSNGVVYQ